MADPEFPQGAPTYDFAKFSQKLHEIERIWVPRGGGTPHASLNPPLITNIMKKFKNGSNSPKCILDQKFQLLTPPPPKVWVSSFQSAARNGSPKHILELPITDPSKVSPPVFQVCVRHYENWKFSKCQWFSVYPTSHLYVVLHVLILFQFTDLKLRCFMIAGLLIDLF